MNLFMEKDVIFEDFLVDKEGFHPGLWRCLGKESGVFCCVVWDCNMGGPKNFKWVIMRVSQWCGGPKPESITM